MQIFTVQLHLVKKIEYPSRYRRESLLKTVLIQFCIVFLFLLLFKPFGVYESQHKIDYTLICGLHALLPAVIIFLYFQILGLFQNNKSQAVWSPLQEYVHLAIVFFLIGIASFLLRSVIYNTPDNWCWRYLWEEIRNCYLAGILFYFLLRFANLYSHADQRSNQIAPPGSGTCADAEKTSDSNTQLFIKTQVQQDDFSFDPAKLLFAKAEGNYIELTVYADQNISTELKRISLKNFEAQLKAYPFLFRCHRAYLVNLLQIHKVSGNAQGYLLSLNSTEERIPVSRAQLELFNDRYRQLASI